MLCELYEPNIPAERLKVLSAVYFMALKEHSIDELKMAFTRVVKSREYNGLPKPAELLHAIKGTADQAALLAFQKLLKGIRYVGPYSNIQFDDATIHTTIEFLGGWKKVCDVKEDDLKWLEKDFIAAYRVALNSKEHKPFLPGLHHIQNEGHSHDVIPSMSRIEGDNAKVITLLNKQTKEIIDGTRTGIGEALAVRAKRPETSAKGTGDSSDGFPG
jgi:hypothetical protein